MTNADWGHVSLRDFITEQFRARDEALKLVQRDLDETRTQLEAIRRDHVPRRDHERLTSQLDQIQGRRTAAAAIVSIMVVIVLSLVGIAWNSVPTHDEITAQIQRDAPWVTDRPEIERRINGLERTVDVNSNRIDDIEALNEFFCSTRVKADLPGCTP